MHVEIRNVGNSLALILPEEVLSALQVTAGDTVHLERNALGFQLSAADTEFARQMEHARSLLHRYHSTMRELAK